MKHFVIEIQYTIPLEKLEEIVPAHRAFLDSGYRSGLLLCSGPQNPRVGGLVVARAESREAIEAFFAHDPYQLQGVATYRFVEFEPVKMQPWFEGWVKGQAQAS